MQKKITKEYDLLQIQIKINPKKVEVGFCRLFLQRWYNVDSG